MLLVIFLKNKLHFDKNGKKNFFQNKKIKILL